MDEVAEHIPLYIQVAKDFAWYGVIAMVVTAFATPVAATLARRYGVLDVPDQQLKPHARPTPYLGGVAICLGWVAAILVAIAARPSMPVGMIVPILLGGVAMSLLGLFDDVRELPPKLRLAVGAAVIAAVMLSSGAGFDLTRTFLKLFGIDPPVWLGVPVSFVLGLFIVLGACNSTNLIDGLDGLCAGVTAIIALGFFVIAARLAVVEYSREANDVRLVLAIAMFGAAMGFLPLNFNPAKIFMGDAGSVLLGYNCGMLLLLFAERGTTVRWILGGLMVFALPIFDTALAIVRRWRSGRSIFAGDRSHFYDQLVDRGLSVRRVVMISYGLAGFYALLGSLVAVVRLRYIVPLYAVVIVATIVAILKAGMIRAEPQPERAGAADPLPETS